MDTGKQFEEAWCKLFVKPTRASLSYIHIQAAIWYRKKKVLQNYYNIINTMQYALKDVSIT